LGFTAGVGAGAVLGFDTGGELRAGLALGGGGAGATGEAHGLGAAEGAGGAAEGAAPGGTGATDGTSVAPGCGGGAGGDGAVTAAADREVAAVEGLGEVDEAVIRTATPTPARRTSEQATATVLHFRLERGDVASVLVGGAVMASGEGGCTGFSRVAASADSGSEGPDGRTS